MWLQRFTNYLLEHRWQSILLCFAVTFLPVIGILGILIAALVTLRKDIMEGALLMLAATLPYVLSFYLVEKPSSTPTVVVWAGVSVAVLSNVLTWVFAVTLRRQVSWSVMLQVAALLGVLTVSVIHLLNPQVTEWWGSQLQAYYAQLQTAAHSLKSPTPVAVSADTRLEMINIAKQYATGVMVTAILFNGLLQLVVARWWQAAVFNPGGLRRELQEIRLSPLAGVLFIVSVICSYFGNPVVSDIMPILYILFGVAGLSLIHYLFGLTSSSTRWFWLLLVYVLLIIALPTSVMLIAMLALFDVWLDVRRRLVKIK